LTKTRRASAFAGVLAAALLAVTSLAVTAQDDAQPTTVADVNSGAVSGTVTIDGVALGQKGGDDDEFFFSDGTGVTVIDVNDEDKGVPQFTLINIVGQVASDEIDVSSWTLLEAPTANLGPREEAFMAWVALFGDDDMVDDDDDDDTDDDDDADDDD
jgi:uncharacterized protein YdeI (BOF family)